MKKPKDMNEALGQTSNRILAGTAIEGEVKSEGDIRVDGHIKGRITITGKLVVGEKGQVEGEIKCANATVSGALMGDIAVEGLLTLQATARVQGDVRTGKLAVEPGAEFSGSCNMGSVNPPLRNGETRSKQEKGAADQKASQATA